MRQKITALFVKTLQPKATPYEVRDSELLGFLVRVQPSGVISYYYSYSNRDGKKKRVSLGKHGAVTVFQAREAAAMAAGDVAVRRDPAEDKKAARSVAAAAIEAKEKQRTLGQFVDREYRQWAVANKKRGENDIKRVEQVFKRFLDVPLSEITTWNLEKWRAARLKDMQKATVQRDLAELRAVLNRAVDWGFLQESPMRKFRMLKFDNARVRFLTAAEAKRLNEALANRDRRIIVGRASANAWRAERGYELHPDLSNAKFGDYLTPMVRLSLHTGLRKGELFALNWASIDIDLRLLTVRAKTAKADMRREIPLNDDAMEILKNWRAQTKQEVGLVFPSPLGGMFDNVQKSWAAALKEAKIEGFVWHDLRHTFASNLVMKGKDLNSVRELLGHKDIKMTLRYAHLAPGHKADVVAALVGTA